VRASTCAEFGGSAMANIWWLRTGYPLVN
jgi:hypothetical protein